MQNNFIPSQEKGKHLDVSLTETYDSAHEAMTVYKRACNRLLHPQTWQHMTGSLSASFEAISTNTIQLGDYIEIDIPGPGSPAGDGKDWVRVTAIAYTIDRTMNESFGLTLEASENPGQPEKGTAHFFEKGASSTFIIGFKNKEVVLSYHGRNELPNTENDGLLDKARNVLVAIGAFAGASKIQWKAFLKGLIEDSGQPAR